MVYRILYGQNVSYSFSTLIDLLLRVQVSGNRSNSPSGNIIDHYSLCLTYLQLEESWLFKRNWRVSSPKLCQVKLILSQQRILIPDLIRLEYNTSFIGTFGCAGCHRGTLSYSGMLLADGGFNKASLFISPPQISSITFPVSFLSQDKVSLTLPTNNMLEPYFLIISSSLYNSSRSNLGSVII